MNNSTKKRIAAHALCNLVAFYGVNWLAHWLLPKWVDVLVGTAVSFYFLWRIALYFHNK